LACHSSGDQLPIRANGTEATPGNGYAYILGIDPKRRKLIYATRIGGHGYTAAFRVKVDDRGVAYVVGITNAKDFPTTVDAVQRELGGDRDAFLIKLSPDGQVLYSTFLGGAGTDEGYGLELDEAGGAYVAGPTSSRNFPGQTTTRDVHGFDAFVAHVRPGQPDSLRSVVFGGSKDDRLTGIVADRRGGIYAVGTSRSPDFITLGSHLNGFSGASKVFLTRLDKATLQPAFSRLFGGSGDDSGWGVAVNNKGDVFVAGTTNSPDLPGSATGFQNNFQGATDAFVAKFSGSSHEEVITTYLGGKGEDSSGFDGDDIKIDKRGNIWLTGTTASLDFPLRNALHTENFGKRDGFVAALSPDLSKLCYGTYLGEPGGGALEGLDLSPDNVSVATTGFSFTNPIGTAPLVDPKSVRVFRLNGAVVHAVVFSFKPQLNCR
jgi:hypothetical protein